MTYLCSYFVSMAERTAWNTWRRTAAHHPHGNFEERRKFYPGGEGEIFLSANGDSTRGTYFCRHGWLVGVVDVLLLYSEFVFRTTTKDIYPPNTHAHKHTHTHTHTHTRTHTRTPTRTPTQSLFSWRRRCCLFYFFVFS